MKKKEYKLDIYFGSEIANLYELGYLTIDLQQLQSYSRLISEKNIEQAEKYFGEKSRPINRYSSQLTKGTKSEIINVKKGSIELAIAGATLIAAVVMPIVAIKVQQELKYENQLVRFEISPQDESIQTHLQAYAKGNYGYGEKGLEALFEILQRLNYSVQITREDIYSIEHVTNKYAQRMVKTIKKNAR